MWTYFYKSKDRLKDIAYQINPNLSAEFNSFIEDEGEIQGEIEGKTDSLLKNLISFSAKGSANKKRKKTRQVKNTISEESIINSIEKYFKKGTYSYLTNESEEEDLKNIKNLIRISGTFKIDVKGKDHFARINDFKEKEFIKWTSCFERITVKFMTKKGSYTTSRPSPIVQGLSNSSKSFYIDGFGTLMRQLGKTIEISPLFLGCQFDL